MHRITALPCAVLALALAGCAGQSQPAAMPSPAASPSSPSSPSAASSPTALPRPTGPVADQTISITYADGKVSGVPALVKVRLNSTVALTVTSDVADEVHLHGYDKSVVVAKGGTATIVFKATSPGRYVVELEKLHRRLATLQIQ